MDVRRYYFNLTLDYISKISFNRILDVGCGDGKFLTRLTKYDASLYGVDVNVSRDKNSKGKNKIVLKKVKSNENLPFKNGYFDIVTLFHTLEHVQSEKKVISEIYRVLSPGGSLIIASPYKGIFSWADMANIRFLSPGLHRWFIETFLGKKVYNERFLNAKKGKMWGDCYVGRKWHHHYKDSELKKLLSKWFVVDSLRKYSLFYPFLILLYNIRDYFFNKESKVINWMIKKDNKINMGDLSYNFWLVAKKKA